MKPEAVSILTIISACHFTKMIDAGRVHNPRVTNMDNTTCLINAPIIRHPAGLFMHARYDTHPQPQAHFALRRHKQMYWNQSPLHCAKPEFSQRIRRLIAYSLRLHCVGSARGNWIFCMRMFVIMMSPFLRISGMPRSRIKQLLSLIWYLRLSLGRKLSFSKFKY